MLRKPCGIYQAQSDVRISVISSEDGTSEDKFRGSNHSSPIRSYVRLSTFGHLPSQPPAYLIAPTLRDCLPKQERLLLGLMSLN